MQTWINFAITKQERTLGASLEWMRELARTSVAALFKFALVGPLGNHRKYLPKNAWHVARLAATQHEDCGSCVQIVVNLALKDGINGELLDAVLRTKTDSLPPELAQVHQFATTIASGQDDPELRELLRTRFGEQAFAELALAIATSRLIPTTKRALGYAQSCSLVQVTVNPNSCRNATPSAATQHV